MAILQPSVKASCMVTVLFFDKLALIGTTVFSDSVAVNCIITCSSDGTVGCSRPGTDSIGAKKNFVDSHSAKAK